MNEHPEDPMPQNPNPHPVVVGVLELDRMVDQLVHTAALQGISAEDLTTFTPDQWNELAGAAMQVQAGGTRLSVIRRMH